VAHDENLRLLELAALSERCARQTELFFQRQPHNPHYCHELWRRAIVDGDTRAWERLYTQYHPLVAGWVRRHSAFADCGDDIHHLVNCAFEKMWFALDPSKFAQFADVPSLLRYLQMCVHSAILDAVRRAEDPAEVAPETLSDDQAGSAPTVEGAVLGRLQRQELWQAVLARLADERERLVVYGSYALGLTPRELCAEYAGSFADVKEVYRIKENVLDRLRRDAGLAHLLAWDA